HDAADGVADFAGHHPPGFFPGAHAASGPHVTVVLDGAVDAAGHGAERVADHVRGALKDGKLRTEMEQRIGDGHGSSSLMADGKDDKGREAGSVCAFNFLLWRLLWQFLSHGGFFSGREQVSQCEYEKIRTGADHGNARLRYSPGEQDGANNGNETGDGTCRAQRRA